VVQPARQGRRDRRLTRRRAQRSHADCAIAIIASQLGWGREILSIIPARVSTEVDAQPLAGHDEPKRAACRALGVLDPRNPAPRKRGAVRLLA
jgi:hypothetical protein